MTLGFSSLGLLRLLYILKFFCLLPLVISSNETENDRQALLCFKSQLTGSAEVLSSWSNGSIEFCSWHGVTCSTKLPRRVIALDLSSKRITGPISPCIANLTNLTILQLPNNSFHGRIPSELSFLSELSILNISMNSLEGNIPSELSSCSKLQEINLSNNNLQGNIPSAFGDLTELQKLNLASNRLSGDIPQSLGSNLSLTYVNLGSNALTGRIPETLASSISLQVLVLMSNSLSGELPKALFNSSSLIYLYLQQNSFVGSIPPITAISPQMKYLDLKENHLTGTIPSSIGNLTSLIYLRLTENNLVGRIPDTLGHVPTLETLEVHVNNLSGPVPPSIFNVSSLTYLGMANNSLIGRLPSNIGYTLPNIQELILLNNKFSNSIPNSLLNATHLQTLSLANNSLTGAIPIFGSLRNLEFLDMAYNMLEASDWSFISSLSNCSKLTSLMLDGNNLRGILLSSIGNLSSSLKELWLRNNQISGPIPPGIGNLKSLNILYMDYNYLTGNIPPTIGYLHNMVILSFAQNKLSGQIPGTIGNLVQLYELNLDGNNFSGSIPASIRNCTRLRALNLAQNSLHGSVPIHIFKIFSLSEVLNLSFNYLSGGIPQEVGNLINLRKFSISNNRLSGNVPSTLGQCVFLESLELQSNSLVGIIPESLVRLEGIQKLDISHNKLSGKIPEFLASFKSIVTLNLSFNDFYGPVPHGGAFVDANVISIEGNDRLCVSTPMKGIPFCSALVDRGRVRRSLVLALKVAIPVVFVAITISCLLMIRLRKRMQLNSRKTMQLNTHVRLFSKNMKRITYEDIVKATKGFSSANLIGSGSFGTVYKGNLEKQQNQVAIKIFNLGTHGAHRSFVAECEALRNVRHRNLIKIVTVCSSVDSTGTDFRALVFEYMQNGNLDMWLHPKEQEHSQRNFLTLSQRVNIASDIAFALDYLHNHCASPLIHCDLKPSNVLLGLDMVAYISDFGLARFLRTRSNSDQDSSTSMSCLKGSVGYIPPEYGMSEKRSRKGDVYSFGVLILEMVTGISPVDEIFSDGTSLRDLVAKEFPKNIEKVVDSTMLQHEIDVAEVVQSCIIPLVGIGLSCSMTSPKDRCEMGQVCSEILRIKHALSKIDDE
uniref:Receptor kinase-like protein Xa21 n=1 Tax=Leersia perrieri TaxID=77586 RepID=A0A0D9WRK4_9ORYZ